MNQIETIFTINALFYQCPERGYISKIFVKEKKNILINFIFYFCNSTYYGMVFLYN